MSQLVFTPPGRNEPGFLRRMRTALSFQKRLSDDPSLEAFDEMMDFLLDYVHEPEDREEARELLMDASEQQFVDMLSSLGGETENPT